jgi:hypothetical protein
MLSYFLREAASRVRKPVIDATGQSVHIDAELGPENSDARRALSSKIESISRVAESSQSLRQWRELLD